MGHNLVVGGQPDYLSTLIPSWTEHGREIAAGDAEKVLDLAPSVRYRLPSVGSGEPYFRTDYSNHIHGSNVPLRGILGAVHNLVDVGAKARVVVGDSTATFVKKFGTSTVSVTGLTSSGGGAATFADVDQDPHATPSTYATPASASAAWHLEVGTFDAAALSSTEDSQVAFVRLRSVGTHNSDEPAAPVTIKIKEGATVRAQKTIQVRLANGEDIITSVLFDPDDFIDPTMTNLSIRVESSGNSTPGAVALWRPISICWLRVAAASLSHDSGWWAVEEPEHDLFYMSADVQGSSVIPYLDADGLVVESFAGASATTLVLFYWDESTDVVASTGRPRIFDQSNGPTTVYGTLTSWRPEIGLIAEGPAWGTTLLQPQYRSGFLDTSDVRESKGGNLWSRRKEPRRWLEVTITDVAAEEAMRELYSVFRRAGQTRSFCVALTPADEFSADVSAALSIYARITNFTISEQYAEKFQADIRFEEVV